MNGEAHLEGPVPNPVVFLDIKIGPAKAGRIIIELFSDKVQKTCENFRALCTGEKGTGKKGKPLHYKNTTFHRVVPMFMIQGGDVTDKDGTGGESIYGESFKDENFEVTHDVAGIVGMANNGPNSNSSQFYITTVPCPHLDNTNVGFGVVKKGLNIVIEVTEVPRNNDKPLETVVIENCGELKPDEDWCIEEKDCTEDIYPPWPNDWDVKPTEDEKITTAIHRIKDSGNYFFNENNLVDSERKYVKALRYIDWYISIDKNAIKKVSEIRIMSLLNLAAVCLKKKKYKQVIDLCTQVIVKQPKNAKAFYRRAQARLAAEEHDKALIDLQMARSILPSDNNIQAVLKNARNKKLSYLQREKQFYGNLFK